MSEGCDRCDRTEWMLHVAEGEVKRLRTLLDTAAERDRALTAEVDHLTLDAAGQQDLLAEIEELEAENERLRATRPLPTSPAMVMRGAEVRQLEHDLGEIRGNLVASLKTALGYLAAIRPLLRAIKPCVDGEGWGQSFGVIKGRVILASDHDAIRVAYYELPQAVKSMADAGEEER